MTRPGTGYGQHVRQGKSPLIRAYPKSSRRWPPREGRSLAGPSCFGWPRRERWN